MCSRASERGRRAGFTLFEALVALTVASLLLPTLARALAEAWAASRRPIETVSAVALARAALAGSVPVEAQGFGISRSSAPLVLEKLPSDVAPAPAGAGSRKKESADGGLNPGSVPASMRLAIPASFGTPGPGGPASAAPSLRHVSVAVRMPSGRRLLFDGIVLDAPSP